jgi:hypothetical protein
LATPTSNAGVNLDGPTDLPKRVFVLSRVITVVISVVPTGAFLFVALRRIAYPYELEWLEGGAVEIVRRVASGHAIYVQPSLHYVPYPYTPLYFWACGILSHVVGVGFLPLRLVSLLSSVGCAVMLVAIVRRETGDAVAGVVASGLFMVTYAVGGAWLDIGRVDSFALCLLLISLYVARGVEGTRGGLLLGALIFIAFMAKQSDLVATAPLLIFLLFGRRRAGIVALLTVSALVVGSTWALDARTHGWYGYYVFTELTHQGVVSSVWRTFFIRDLWHLPWVIGLAIIGVVVDVLHNPDDRRSSALMFWPVAASGLMLSAFVSRLHSGGGEDVLIPAYAGLAILGAMGYAAVVRDARVRMLAVERAQRKWTPALVTTGLTLIVAIQIAALHYSPTRYIPTASDRTAGRRFIELVRRTPGPVIVSNHPYYDTLAGKTSWAQGEAVHDVLRAGPSAARSDLTASIDTFLMERTPTTIFSDAPGYALGAYSDADFRLTSTRVFACPRCFFPVTDIKRRPAYRFVRR